MEKRSVFTDLAEEYNVSQVIYAHCQENQGQILQQDTMAMQVILELILLVAVELLFWLQRVVQLLSQLL